MAERKLFELVNATPTDSDNIVFGKSGHTYYNINMVDFKTYLNGSNQLNTSVIEIGSWNMFVLVGIKTISLSGIDIMNIRKISIMIRNDDNDEIIDFLSIEGGGGLNTPKVLIKNNVITLIITNSYFNNTSYQKTNNPDSSIYNRGWITIDYVD